MTGLSAASRSRSTATTLAATSAGSSALRVDGVGDASSGLLGTRLIRDPLPLRVAGLPSRLRALPYAQPAPRVAMRHGPAERHHEVVARAASASAARACISMNRIALASLCAPPHSRRRRTAPNCCHDRPRLRPAAFRPPRRDVTPAQNHLIERLPPRDRRHLMSIAEPVMLVLGEVLCQRGAPTRHVYFPVDAF